jgi:hypothetical protein
VKNCSFLNHNLYAGSLKSQISVRRIVSESVTVRKREMGRGIMIGTESVNVRKREMGKETVIGSVILRGPVIVTVIMGNESVVVAVKEIVVDVPVNVNVIMSVREKGRESMADLTHESGNGRGKWRDNLAIIT